MFQLTNINDPFALGWSLNSLSSSTWKVTGLGLMTLVRGGAFLGLRTPVLMALGDFFLGISGARCLLISPLRGKLVTADILQKSAIERGKNSIV